MPFEDTATHVWTIHGYMPRSDLLESAGVEESSAAVLRWRAFHAVGTGELVRRDVATTLKTGITIGARASIVA